MLPTVLTPVPFAPEISLHLVTQPVGLFDLTGGEFHSDQPPPFWAFAWAGGQALARHLLDDPAVVAGRRVLDVATGSGVAAVAAAYCGAAAVACTDLDPAAVQAAHRNASANGLSLVGRLDGHPEVVLAGDVFYSPIVAPKMIATLREARKNGATVLVGDPGRGFFPGRLFELVTEYVVPVPAVLEETEALTTGVWRMK
ncbi:class I SAM-dependent methyltransferase [Actinoplanes derwentensis]|uniref:Predicted nicotinamide N-methyase n=1 Tax=Actinoplanes derwentensis TaxID=113562 RepID=A0A1H2CE37_9ACTN|nr:50S ribosomal protein L11 methyltransferase [Actinoplanes derwentensis]GID89943.1 50S ribosomal protein L11 methyltransferase [Actinoplanes derwentensis]SDT68604.1 Predicted nicotinamide N-methyase [Actinoplanes derwentensis]